jgi:hypothetical protein
LRMIDTVLREGDPESPKGMVRRAEALIEMWRPGTPSAEVAMYVSRTNGDLVSGLRERITEINGVFAEVEAEGQEYVASGQPAPEVVVLVDDDARQERKQGHLSKYLHLSGQSHAQLDIGSIKPADRA